MPAASSPFVRSGGAGGSLQIGRPARRLRRPHAAGAVVLTGVVLVALTLRPAVTAVSPVLAQVRADLDMSTTEAGLLGTAPALAFAAAGALAPALARRVGLERLAVLAMLVTTVGQLLRAVAPGTATFLLCSLAALVGMGIGNVVLPPLVKRYYPDRLGAVTGAYVLLLALGTALPPLVAVPVSAATSWRVSVGQWALLSLAAALPWWLAHRRAVREHAAATTPVTPRRHVPASALLRSRVAWGLAGLLGMTSLNTYALLAWLPTLLADAGLSAGRAGVMLSLYAAVGMPGALVVPWVAARMRNPLPLVVACLVCFAVGYLGLAVAPATHTALWVAAAGVAPGAFPLSLALVNLRSATTEGSAALSGFAQGIGYSVAGAGPLVVGWLHDLTGTWDAAFAFLGVTLVVQLVGGIVVCRPRTVEDDLAGATTLDR